MNGLTVIVKKLKKFIFIFSSMFRIPDNMRNFIILNTVIHTTIFSVFFPTAFFHVKDVGTLSLVCFPFYPSGMKIYMEIISLILFLYDEI